MSWFRYLLFPSLIGPAFLLTGTLKHQGEPPTATASAMASPLLTPAVADPVATEIFAQATQNLSPNQVQWLEAVVWQQAACGEVAYQAEGRFRAAPGRRFHLELAVHYGKSRGEVEVVSDGTSLWRSTRVNGGERAVAHSELAETLPALPEPGFSPQAGQLPPPFFAGLGLLLDELGRRMLATREEVVPWQGRDMVRLTLAWSPAAASAFAPAGQPWPALLPRRCFLYLDAVTLWPHRLEWWGPANDQGADSLIFQMEFRHPIWNHALTKEQCRREFSFDSGKSQVKVPPVRYEEAAQ
jgi:hypothetical protein